VEQTKCSLIQTILSLTGKNLLTSGLSVEVPENTLKLLNVFKSASIILKISRSTSTPQR